MKRLRNAWAISVAVAVALGISPALALAATSGPVAATVSTTIATTATLSFTRDGTSVARGTAGTLVFDRLDLVDPAVASPSADFMYAPYRSETGKNWHLVTMFGNGATTTLSATVSGSYNGVALSSILKVFCGGFYPADGSGLIGGTKSADWVVLDGYSQSVGPFNGIASMNYQLKVTGLPSGVYAGGAVTYTLTST